MFNGSQQLCKMWSSNLRAMKSMPCFDAESSKAAIESAKNFTNPRQQLEGVKYLREYFLSMPQQVENALDNGMVSMLLEIVKRQRHREIIVNAVFTLANMAAVSSRQEIQFMLAADTITPLFRLFKTPIIEYRECTALALRNLTIDSMNLRNIAIEFDALNAMLDLINPTVDAQLAEHISRILRNFCQSSTLTLPRLVVSRIIRALHLFLHDFSGEIVKNAVVAIRYLTHDEYIEMIIAIGMVPKMLMLLQSPDLYTVACLLFAIAEIVRRSCDHMQLILDYDGLSIFVQLLTHKNCGIRINTLTILQTIATRAENVNAIFAAGTLPKIVYILNHDQEAAHVPAVNTMLSIASQCSHSQLNTLMQLNVIATLCKLLASQDTNVLRETLKCLKKFLSAFDALEPKVSQLIEQNDGLAKMEAFIDHNNDEIFTLAYELLEQYFNEQE